LAEALRKGPFQTNLILGGMDGDKAAMYHLDYLGTLQQVKTTAHGYGAYFTLGLMDRHYYPDLTQQEAIEIIRMCIHELQTRFVVGLPKFNCKIVTKEGIRDVEL
jgi:20S proteasome alpha/beta subunit